MKALTFLAPRQLEYIDIPDPALEDETDVVVKVELAAICGSDLHPYRGHEVGLDQGTVMGHEFLGEVVAVGRGVESLNPGDRVVVPFTTSCGFCFFCQRGLTARCERGELFGWIQDGRGLHGGQAELVRVPLADTTALQIPAALAAAPEALFAGDILATGLDTAARGEVSAATSVAVLGCGPVGLMCVVAAADAGADQVWAIDSVPERLRLAASFGARPVSLEADPMQSIRSLTGSRGVDVVLEAVGSPGASRLACDLVRPGGTIAAAGVHTEEDFAFSPVEAYDKNLTYRAGRASARFHTEAALALIASGRYDLGAIVTHELRLADAIDAYEMFDARRDGCVKVLLRP